MRKRTALLAFAAAFGAAVITVTGAHWGAAAQATQQSITDAQLQAYLAANREIEPISSRVAQMTPQQRLQATAQIRSILRRHDLTGDQYNAIDTQARADQTLARRIAAIRVQDVSDQTLRRFVAALAEIDPISRSLMGEATEAQRAEAAAQIRSVLERHEITAAMYNAIAARAQNDEAFATRIAQLQSSNAPTPDGAQ